jgi:hypothetical protein
MRTPFLAAAASALLVFSIPSAATAGDRDDARVLIAGAKAKVDLNEKNGITGEAAGIQARARVALDRAEKEFDKSNEDTAQAAAKEADALAELASTTQQKQLIEATTAAATPN